MSKHRGGRGGGGLSKRSGKTQTHIRWKRRSESELKTVKNHYLLAKQLQGNFLVKCHINFLAKRMLMRDCGNLRNMTNNANPELGSPAT